MLSPADRDLCARDPELPGLAAILRAAALARWAGLGRMTPVYLRYKPGTSCVAGLLPTGGGLNAYEVMTYPSERYAEVRTRTEWSTAATPPIYLDAICTAIVPATLDRKLPGLGRLADPERAARLLKHLGIGPCTLHLLRYKAGRRAVLRADGPEGPQALIKIHAKDAIDAAIVGARHAEAHGGPAILGVARSKAAIATAWAPGRPLNLGAEAGAMAETGVTLARLHGIDDPDAVEAIEPSVAADEAETLSTLVPGQSQRARAVSAALDALPHESGTSVVHGDFGPDQVICGPTGQVIIDWDRVGQGAPERDLGSFLARFDQGVIRGEITARRAVALAEAFLGGYARHRPFDRAPLRAFRARALFTLANAGFRERRADWAAEISATLARVEDILSSPSLGHEITPGLSLASDPGAMAERLPAALGELRGVEVLRHKPGRRALVAYDTGAGRILGKLRAKGPDRRTPRLHGDLRAGGLDGEVAVPPALGALDEPPIWFQPLVEGETLGLRLMSGENVASSRRAGHALARLHASPVDPGRVWSRDDEMAVLERALGRGADMGDILRDAADWFGAPSTEPVCLHRDFYFDQIILGAETTWLIDLDLAARGEDAIDLGNFLAHLTEFGVRRHGDPAAYRDSGAAFLEGYAGVRPLPRPERLACLHWVSLARHIGLSRKYDGRAHTTAPMTALCRDALAHRRALPFFPHRGADLCSPLTGERRSP